MLNSYLTVYVSVFLFFMSKGMHVLTLELSTSMGRQIKTLSTVY